MNKIAPPAVLARRITVLPPGTLLMMFGAVVELLAVDPVPHPHFPRGRMITVRPATGGKRVSVLVPADFAPITVRCRDRLRRAQSGPR